MKTLGKAGPFLKWAGGKGQLLKSLEQNLPESVKNGEGFRYLEPFVGGGALFFFLAENLSLKQAMLMDKNPALINCYKVVQSDVDPLIKTLAKLEKDYLEKTSEERESLFYEIRKKYNRIKLKNKWGKKDVLQLAAFLIFLNKTCYNGLYRENSLGEFNVPFGKYIKPRICDRENLLCCSEALSKAELKCLDFSASFSLSRKKDLVYMDPPYRPVNKTSSFTQYSKGGFSEDDQKKLAGLCTKMHKKGCYVLLSNSVPAGTKEQDNFYKQNFKSKYFSIKKIKARRAINSKGSARGAVEEVLIKNY